MEKVVLAGITITLIAVIFYFKADSVKKVPSRFINPAFAEYVSAYTAGIIASGSVLAIEFTTDMVDSSVLGTNAGWKRTMDLVYPKPDARIFIPRGFDGKPGSSIFELAHRDENTAVFWHLDGVFIGSTRGNHRLALNPGEGKHVLTLVDEDGQALEEHFTVISSL